MIITTRRLIMRGFSAAKEVNYLAAALQGRPNNPCNVLSFSFFQPPDGSKASPLARMNEAGSGKREGGEGGAEAPLSL